MFRPASRFKELFSYGRTFNRNIDNLVRAGFTTG